MNWVEIVRLEAESAVETLHDSHSRIEFWASDMNLTWLEVAPLL